MTTSYQDFLKSKVVNVEPAGFEVEETDIHPMLFGWQNEIVRWALRLGRAAIFAECGLGKSFMQVEWSRLVARHTGGKVLMSAPLAVASQTIREGQKLGVEIVYCQNQAEADAITCPLIITNYERLKDFDADKFVGVDLDESSILKNFMGATKRLILDMFRHTQYKLACTATPAPNDHLELGNHAEFLGLMPSNEMIMRWFINHAMQAGNYRLKKHAEKDFWRWVTSWAVCISKPSDMGYPDDGFELPPLNFHEHRIDVDHSRAWASGRLFLDGKSSATGIWSEKKMTFDDRMAKVVELVLEETIECGNLNMPNDERRNINQTQKKEQDENLREEPVKTTKNIKKPTTEPTKKRQNNTGKTTPTSGMLDDANGITATQNLETNVGKVQENEIKLQSEIPAFVQNSELTSQPTIASSNSRAIVALSAALNSGTQPDENSTLTTAIVQGESGAFYALSATLDLENLKTTPNSSPELSTILKKPTKFWVVWCDTNDEQDRLEKLLGETAFSIRGADAPAKKESIHTRWLSGERLILLTKTEIFGMGLNWQHCSNMVFVGATFSYERIHQALRRSYRFRQTRPVEAHLIVAETEANVLATLRQKQQAFQVMQASMNEAQKLHGLFGGGDRRNRVTYLPEVEMKVPEWCRTKSA